MWSSTSPDIYQVICSFLKPKGILQLSRTCKIFQGYGSRDVVWKQFETWQDHDDGVVHLSKIEYVEAELFWKQFLSQYFGCLTRLTVGSSEHNKSSKYMSFTLELPKYIKRDWLHKEIGSCEPDFPQFLLFPNLFPKFILVPTCPTLFDFDGDEGIIPEDYFYTRHLLFKPTSIHSLHIPCIVETPEGSMCGLKPMLMRLKTQKSHQLRKTQKLRKPKKVRNLKKVQRKLCKKNMYSKNKFSSRHR